MLNHLKKFFLPNNLHLGEKKNTGEDRMGAGKKDEERGWQEEEGSTSESLRPGPHRQPEDSTEGEREGANPLKIMGEDPLPLMRPSDLFQTTATTF